MDTIMHYNGIVNSFVWGAPVLILLVGTGVYLTLLLGLPQFRYFFQALSEVFSFRKKSDEDKSISSFAAMATAMAATVGTGNVAGVATALHLGGPGALVWMLISAIFGMCTKFAEVTLAVHYRQKDAHGDWRGGTMYILENGAGEVLGRAGTFFGKLLAVLFALFAFLASFGIGAATQANSAAEAISMGWGVDHLYTGIVMAVLVALVIIGGLKSLSTVTTYIVPFMAIFYIAGSVYVLVLNAEMIPGVVSNALHLAFNNPLETLPGALAGWGVKEAVQRGIARGVFSNEAGMGSAPMVHATANVEHPVQQGFYGIFEVFMDTIVICTMTALVVMVTGTLTGSPELTGAQLTLKAFET
ncbi:MAG: sodium:alanine symporter family protein, partial [Synergistaceae bacterium]|nr:sodium:alanine symporter family protein [Synergistaceae bacterium]